MFLRKTKSQELIKNGSSDGPPLGMRGQYDFAGPMGTVSPFARLEYQRTGGASMFQTMSYAADLSTLYGLSLLPSSRNNLSGSLGLKAAGGQITGSLEYAMSGAPDGDVHGQGLRGAMQLRYDRSRLGPAQRDAAPEGARGKVSLLRGKVSRLTVRRVPAVGEGDSAWAHEEQVTAPRRASPRRRGRIRQGKTQTPGAWLE
jgi:hypothetical protein